VELALIKIRFAEESTLVADVHPVAIAHVEQALLQEARSTVTHHAVALHFAEAKSSVARPTFRWLSRQNLSRPTRSRVNLIAHHML
jgi:hypothetical protein